MARAQKWGGVHMNTMANMTQAGRPTWPVTAAQPTSTGTAPAADDDVLRRGPLQPHRVDEDVEGGGAHRQPGRQQVHRGPQPDEGRHLQGDPEAEGGGGADRAAGERPAMRPAHLLVDVPVEDAVDRVGP